jgi:beta-lactamase class A
MTQAAASRRSRQQLDQNIAGVQGRFAGQLGIAATNLATGEQVMVNAEQVFPTASVIKVAVLAELFAQADEGRLKLDERLTMQASDIVGGSGVLKELVPGLQPTLMDLAMLMVVLSDNTATNMLIDRVGGCEGVNRRIQGEYGFLSIALHNRVDFEKIGPDVRRFAEATPLDLLRFMTRLARKELVSASASQEMLRLMSRQQYLDQVPRYLKVNPYARELKVQPEVGAALKTGFFPGTRVDAGILTLADSVDVAYCVAANGSADPTIAPESEPAVVNGLIGKLLVEYWWPETAPTQTGTLPTAYAAAYGLERDS